MTSIDTLNTAKRIVKKEENKLKIICKLSIVLGSAKKGEIVVREGDNLQELAKTFVATYGMKKDTIPTIISSLDDLIRNSYQRNSQKIKQKSNKNNVS